MDDLEEHQARIRVSSGIEIATVDWGGSGPLVLLHHASGFCAAVWRVVARHLRSHYRVVGFDARGHGDSDKPSEGYGWHVFADDLVDVARQVCLSTGHQRVHMCAGHSLGGIATLLAVGRAADLFERAALLDPVLIDAELARAFVVRADGSTASSLTTRMRQASFSSRDEALALWRSQSLYDGCDGRALRDYADAGLAEQADGRFQLKCPPSIEASIYALGETVGGFDRVELPVLLLSARDSRFADCQRRFAAGSPRVDLRTLDAGHLMPLQKPDLIAELLLEYAGQK